MKKLLLMIVAAGFSLRAVAAVDYPHKVLANVTGDVDQVQFDPAQVSLTLTNLPGGGRRAIVNIIGATGGPGGTNVILVAQPGVLLTTQGTGTNGIGADFSLIVSNQMTGVKLNGGEVISTADTTDFYPLASNPAGYLTAASANTNAVTNATSTATALLSVSLSDGILTLSPFTGILTNQQIGVQLNGGPVVSTGDTTDFYPRVSNPAGYLTAATANTNGQVVASGYDIVVTPGTLNTQIVNAASSVVDVNSNNAYATDTMQTPYNLTVAGNGTASNNFTVIQALTSQGSLNAQNGGTIQHGLTVASGDATITGNATIGTNLTVNGTLAANGNFSIGGSLTRGNLGGGTGYQSANLDGLVGTNQLAAFSGNTGTIGSSGNYLVVHLNSAGIPDGWSTVSAGPSGVATNAVSAVENANSATWYNNVTGVIFTNFSDFASNGATNIIGFNNAPVETIQIFVPTNSTASLGTNFVVHGSTLSISNANAQGGTFSLSSSGTLVVGGSISNLAMGNGAYFTLTTNSSRGSNYGGCDIKSYGGPSEGSQIDTMWDLNAGSLNSAEDLGLNNYNNGVQYNFASYAALPGQDFWMWLGTQATSGAYVGIIEWRLNNGRAGMQYDANPISGIIQKGVADQGLSINCGTVSGSPFGNGYDPVTIGNGLVINQRDVSGNFMSHNYFGVNTNDFALTVKKGLANPASATDTVQNSDWVRIGVWNNNASTPMDYVAVSSNLDILAVWFTTGCPSNTSAYGYSTNAMDALRIKTNSFGGFLTGHNATFGAAVTNIMSLMLRDETNGLEVVTVSTNGGGGVYVGNTNNLTTIFIGPRSEATNVASAVTDGSGNLIVYSPTFPRIDDAALTLSNATLPMIAVSSATISNARTYTIYNIVAGAFATANTATISYSCTFTRNAP